MLTIGYCRVSTEEQAIHGYSIEGQSDKVSGYAALHGFGAVTVVTDPGFSGRSLDRPGLRRVLALVDEGHVERIIVWRLDRLSRRLADLIDLGEQLVKRDIGLHSVSENLDFSSATGRMMFNIIGAFAQFYREQLSENTRMGLERAVAEGRCVTPPKFGYSMIDKELVPNDDAPTVRLIFKLAAEGKSFCEIARRVGLSDHAIGRIVRSRIYVGDVLLSGRWYPGRHQPIVTETQQRAALRGRRARMRRGRDMLSGHVWCGLCRGEMNIASTSDHPFYVCRRRDDGCVQPRRAASGLHRAALLGVAQLAANRDLQQAIRSEIDRLRARLHPDRPTTATHYTGASETAIDEKRRKLLELFYVGTIDHDFFRKEYQRLSLRKHVLAQLRSANEADVRDQDAVGRRYDELATRLDYPDIPRLWAVASAEDRRLIIDEVLDRIDVFPDHLDVHIHGTPVRHVLYKEIGLRAPLSEIRSPTTRRPSASDLTSSRP